MAINENKWIYLKLLLQQSYFLILYRNYFVPHTKRTELHSLIISQCLYFVRACISENTSAFIVKFTRIKNKVYMFLTFTVGKQGWVWNPNTIYSIIHCDKILYAGSQHGALTWEIIYFFIFSESYIREIYYYMVIFLIYYFRYT